MKAGRWFAVSLALALSPYGRADVTLRHSLTFKFAPFLPPEAEKQARRQLSETLPAEVLVRIQGDRVYSSFGPLFTITDYAKNQITLLNPKTRQFATVGLGEEFDRIAAAQQIPPLPPDAARAMGNLSIDVQTSKTGLTAAIRGIQAEQEVIAMSMTMAGTQGVPSAMRLEMQFWVAQAEEIRRYPALRELADYAERAQRAFNPVALIEKIFSSLPATGDSLRAPLEQLMKANGTLVLKLHAAVYIPALSQAVAFSGQAPDGFEPDGPLAEYEMDVTDLSNTPIADSVFAIPADYHAAPLEDLIRAVVHSPSSIPAAAPR